ncbi:hypothetical protein GCM10009592_28330 [Brachybacterium rhamnosum]|uniref:Uncharacterized protein n=1 Tax=Brachybacterium rhamnosum TaxID=173361 RepID=A0ABW4Q1M3_9MICO
MTTTQIRNQIQAGITARIDQPILNAAQPLTLAYRTLFGWDGTTLDDAVEQAYTPTGPSRDILRARIAFRRAHPQQLHPARAAA